MSLSHKNESAAINDQDRKRARRSSHRIKLPGFIKEEVGLGDLIKKATYSAGIKPCAGCRRRAATLNRWLVFSPRGS